MGKKKPIQLLNDEDISKLALPSLASLMGIIAEGDGDKGATEREENSKYGGYDNKQCLSKKQLEQQKCEANRAAKHKKKSAKSEEPKEPVIEGNDAMAQKLVAEAEISVAEIKESDSKFENKDDDDEEPKEPVIEGNDAMAQKLVAEVETSVAEIKESDSKFENKDDDDEEPKCPITVKYCPNCTFPAEMCEYSGMYEKCKPWLLEQFNEEDKLHELLEASEKGRKRKVKTESDRIQAMLNQTGKHKVEKAIVFELKKRANKKHLTIIRGLNLFNLNMKEICQDLKKKFSTGVGITEEEGKLDAVEIQGNFIPEVSERLINVYGVSKDVLFSIEGKNKIQLFPPLGATPVPVPTPSEPKKGRQVAPQPPLCNISDEEDDKKDEFFSSSKRQRGRGGDNQEQNRGRGGGGFRRGGGVNGSNFRGRGTRGGGNGGASQGGISGGEGYVDNARGSRGRGVGSY